MPAATRPLLAVAAAAMLVACAPKQTRLTGVITSLRPQLCVGAPAAAGACYRSVPPTTLVGFNVGDCVTVWASPASTVRRLVKTVRASNKHDCPPPTATRH